MPFHVEYCRQPAYRAWKAGYDREYRARDFGDFAAAYLTLLDLQGEIKARATDQEIRTANETLCKSQKRKREYAQNFHGQDRTRRRAKG